MHINEWPRLERPRERLIDLGAAALSNAELLAIFLSSGTRGRSAVDLARHLLIEFGSLRNLMTAPREQLKAQSGVGDARFALLRAALELSRRHYEETLRCGPPMTRAVQAHALLRCHLRDRPYEVFCCLHLDSRLRLIALEELFRGTIDDAAVYPREVARQALAHNSAAVILAHNHPSGSAEPSEADREVTRQVAQALALIDVRVLDHLVIGDGAFTSLGEAGLMEVAAIAA